MLAGSTRQERKTTPEPGDHSIAGMLLQGITRLQDAA
jgi:hypothetical protein